MVLRLSRSDLIREHRRRCLSLPLIFCFGRLPGSFSTHVFALVGAGPCACPPYAAGYVHPLGAHRGAPLRCPLRAPIGRPQGGAPTVFLACNLSPKTFEVAARRLQRTSPLPLATILESTTPVAQTSKVGEVFRPPQFNAQRLHGRASRAPLPFSVPHSTCNVQRATFPPSIGAPRDLATLRCNVATGHSSCLAPRASRLAPTITSYSCFVRRATTGQSKVARTMRTLSSPQAAQRSR